MLYVRDSFLDGPPYRTAPDQYPTVGDVFPDADDDVADWLVVDDPESDCDDLDYKILIQANRHVLHARLRALGAGRYGDYLILPPNADHPTWVALAEMASALVRDPVLDERVYHRFVNEQFADEVERGLRSSTFSPLDGLSGDEYESFRAYVHSWAERTMLGQCELSAVASYIRDALPELFPYWEDASADAR